MKGFNFFFFFFFMLIIFFFLMLIYLILKTNYIIKNKFETVVFECGFIPSHFMRVSFSLRFFLISLVFLMFDVEVVLLMPLVLVKQALSFFLVTFFVFFILVLLLLGLLFEWEQGVFNWNWNNI